MPRRTARRSYPTAAAAAFPANNELVQIERRSTVIDRCLVVWVVSRSDTPAAAADVALHAEPETPPALELDGDDR